MSDPSDDQTVPVILTSVAGKLNHETCGKKHDIAMYKRWGFDVREDEGNRVVPVEKKMTLGELTSMIRDFSECESGNIYLLTGVLVEVKPRKDTHYNGEFAGECADEAAADELIWEVSVFDD